MALYGFLTFLLLLGWGIRPSLSDANVCVTWGQPESGTPDLWSDVLPCPQGARALVFGPKDKNGTSRVQSANVGGCASAGSPCELESVKGVSNGGKCWVSMECYNEDNMVGRCTRVDGNNVTIATLDYACLAEDNMSEFLDSHSIRGRVLVLSVHYTMPASYDLQGQSSSSWSCAVESAGCDPRPVRVTALRSPSIQDHNCSSWEYTTISVNNVETRQGWSLVPSQAFSAKDNNENTSIFVSLRLTKCDPRHFVYVILESLDSSDVVVTCNLSEDYSRQCVPATAATRSPTTDQDVWTSETTDSTTATPQTTPSILPSTTTSTPNTSTATQSTVSKMSTAEGLTPSANENSGSGSADDGSGKFPVAPVAGGTAGVVVVLVSLLAVFVCIRRKRRLWRKPSDPSVPVKGDNPAGEAAAAIELNMEERPAGADPADTDYDVLGKGKSRDKPAADVTYGHLAMATEAGGESDYDHVTRGDRRCVITDGIYDKATFNVTSDVDGDYDSCRRQQDSRVNVIASPYDVVTVASPPH